MNRDKGFAMEIIISNMPRICFDLVWTHQVVDLLELLGRECSGDMSCQEWSKRVLMIAELVIYAGFL